MPGTLYIKLICGITFVALILKVELCCAQEKVLKPHESFVLRDIQTNFTYVLDTSHTVVTAFDAVGKIMWSVKPDLEFFEVPDDYPKKIEAMGFYNHEVKVNGVKMIEKRIWYSHYRCGGDIELSTGKSEIRGCD